MGSSDSHEWQFNATHKGHTRAIDEHVGHTEAPRSVRPEPSTIPRLMYMKRHQVVSHTEHASRTSRSYSLLRLRKPSYRDRTKPREEDYRPLWWSQDCLTICEMFQNSRNHRHWLSDQHTPCMPPDCNRSSPDPVFLGILLRRPAWVHGLSHNGPNQKSDVDKAR